MVIQSGLLVSVKVSSGFAGNGDGLLAIAVLLLGFADEKGCSRPKGVDPHHCKKMHGIACCYQS
jgi:hypothetical protein